MNRRAVSTALVLGVLALAACAERPAEPLPADAAPGEAATPSSGPAAEGSGGGARAGSGGAGQALTGRVSGLGALVDELGGRVTDQGLVVPLPADVLFDFDEAEVRPDAEPTLERLATLVGQAGDGPVRVEGHTDAKGDDAYNRTLSEQRAEAVADRLAQCGVDLDRLRTRGLGEAQPVAENAHADGSDNPEGRRQNRRVEVIMPRPAGV